MAAVAWDRLLETCYRRTASVALLIPHSPPIFRVEDEWRALQIPAVEEGELAELTSKFRDPDGRSEGHAYWFFWYGDVAFFHVMAFGYPDTAALVLSRQKPNRPPTNPPVVVARGG
jgi:hypothetical protein